MNTATKESSPLFVAQIISNVPVAKVAMTLAIASMAWCFAIPTVDILFVVFFSLYLMIANRMRFQCNAVARKSETDINLLLLKEDDALSFLKIYMPVFATAGVLLPIMTIILAPKTIQNTLTPHLFLLLSQIHMEGVTGSVYYHNVIRLLVPIVFNAYRISSLLTWTSAAWWQSPTDGWYVWNLGLAMTNLLLWAYNLLVFLLLRVLPRYFDRQMSPAAPVVWKGQVVPILLVQQEKRE